MLYTYTATPKNNSDEEIIQINPFLDKKKPYKQYEQTFQFQHIHYYLHGEIGDPEGYTDMVYRILMANQNDVIYIHLNTVGGRLDTGVQLINAIQNSQANVITVLDGMAYSLGTLIFLAGHEMLVNDHCIIMFHNFKSGIVGKGNEIISELEATVKWFSDLAKQLYVPFLSEEEFNRIIKGEDIWMRSNEIRKRLDKVIKINTQNALLVSMKPKRTRKNNEINEEK